MSATQPVTARLPRADVNALERIAAVGGLSRSALIARAVSERLRQVDSGRPDDLAPRREV
jgi:hypothetical protein